MRPSSLLRPEKRLSSRFSSTVSGATTMRPSGTKASPAPTTLCSGRRDISFSPSRTEPATGRCRPATIARADHGRPIPAAIRQGNVLGAQFHPERSGAAGARFLRAFLDS